LFVYFGLLPLLELLLPPASQNINEMERERLEQDRFFDRLLYLTVPVQLATLLFFLFQIQEPGLNTADTVGRILSMGLMCGVFGINVGHELGHRKPGLAHFLGEVMLLTSLENHFTPYHNRGHHANVATPKDPATARRNEPVFFFWFRSHIGSYVQAWQFEIARMKRLETTIFGLKNKMVVYTLAQIGLSASIYYAFDIHVLLYFYAAAAFGIILLETINYIEHYGLLRQRKENGRYGRVEHWHSWNSDHVFGRMILFELSRHSDHHYKVSKPYQLLESLESSPQMPTGYPGMMLFSLIPPLWFAYMNRRIDALV